MSHDPHTPDPAFVPAPVRPRHDGWTPHRQYEFLQRLADCGCVVTAAAAVRMSPQAAYRLRRHPHAAAFRAAWDGALDQAAALLRQKALQRVLCGTMEIIDRPGRPVVQRRKPCSDRMLMWMLEREEQRTARRHAAQHRDTVPNAPGSAPSHPETDPATPELARFALAIECLPDHSGYDAEERDPWEIDAEPHTPLVVRDPAPALAPGADRLAWNHRPGPRLRPAHAWPQTGAGL